MRLPIIVKEFFLLVCFAFFVLVVPTDHLGVASEEPINAGIQSETSPAKSDPWGYKIRLEPDAKRRMTYRDLKDRLDRNDFLATLKALDTALNEVSDGATFVWQRKNNDLKGAIKPTSAFRAADGRICRHLVFALYLGGYVKSIESIACRKADGRWIIDG